MCASGSRSWAEIAVQTFQLPSSSNLSAWLFLNKFRCATRKKTSVRPRGHADPFGCMIWPIWWSAQWEKMRGECRKFSPVVRSSTTVTGIGGTAFLQSLVRSIPCFAKFPDDDPSRVFDPSTAVAALFEIGGGVQRTMVEVTRKEASEKKLFGKITPWDALLQNVSSFPARYEKIFSCAQSGFVPHFSALRKCPRNGAKDERSRARQYSPPLEFPSPARRGNVCLPQKLDLSPFLTTWRSLIRKFHSKIRARDTHPGCFRDVYQNAVVIGVSVRKYVKTEELRIAQFVGGKLNGRSKACSEETRGKHSSQYNI